MSAPPPVYFAQVREDAEVDRSVVRETKARRVVMIASGGCTALSLLSDVVESVVAVDQNPAQCAVVALRLAALVALDRNAHLAFIGERPATDRLVVYERSVAPLLNAPARSYFDDHPEAVENGVQHCGVTERFYRFVGENLRRSIVADPVWRALFNAPDAAIRAALIDEHFRSETFRSALRVLLSRTTHLEFFPASMFEQAAEHDFGDFFLERFEACVAARDQRDNYFLHQVLFARYVEGRKRGTPYYLSPAGYEEARRNAHKLTVLTAHIAPVLRDRTDVDAVLLSNVFDWASAREQGVLADAACHATRPRGVVLFRNMLADPPLPEPFRRGLLIDERWGKQLATQERSMLYRRVVVGRRR